MAGPFHSLRAMQALHLKISWKVDAREARGRRSESGGRGERNESLQWSLINFHFHPGNPGTLQSVKPQTCRRLEKWQPPVDFRQPRARRIYLFISLLNRIRNNFPLHQSNVFDHWYVFFYLLDIELQHVRSDKNSILWFSFLLHLKRRPHSEIKLPVAINIIYLSVEPEKSVFLDLVLSRFTAVASCSFYSPSWRSTANSSSATLSCTCFWIFLPSGIQSGEETDVGRQRLNLALESLFTFTHLLFRTKQGAWHKIIHLMKGSDFPSTMPVPGSQIVGKTRK